MPSPRLPSTRQLRKIAEKGFLSAIPAAARLGEHIAPGPAARLATWAWTQLPPKVSAQRRQKYTPAGAERVTATVNGIRIVADRFGPRDAPIAWLVHGWGGWRQQMEPFVPTLLEAGYQVIAHDGPSHGDSAPGRRGRRTTSAPEMGASLGALADQWGQPDLLLAHSLGAQASVWAHTFHGLRYRRLVLVAPSVNVDDMTDRFTAYVPMGPTVQERFLHRVKTSLGHDPLDFDLVRRAEDHAGVPVLVIHDESDPETPITSSRALVEAWPDATLQTTAGLGHHRILRSQEARRLLADWLESHPLP